MKKLIVILMLIVLIPYVGLSQQEVGDLSEQRIDYDLALGSTNLDTKNLLGFSRLSFELRSTGFDAADATIQIQKTNGGTNYLDIVGATLIFNSGSNTNFIEIENAKNARYKVVITVGSVTVGALRIEIAATR